MTDRALHDEVIRALADAPYRGSAAWLERDLADPDRVERFARFLARRYYFERVVHFFRYSRALARVSGRWPEAALRGSAFDVGLAAAVLGSRTTAQVVADLVTDHVQDGNAPARIPYLHDLLRYEAAMMIVESGPRLWREDAPASPAPPVGPDEPFALSDGASTLDLEWDLPEILPAILGAWDEPPVAARRACRLIVARTPRGRVSVARLTDPIADALSNLDGLRTPNELALERGVELAPLLEAVAGLLEIGAITRSTQVEANAGVGRT